MGEVVEDFAEGDVLEIGGEGRAFEDFVIEDDVDGIGHVEAFQIAQLHGEFGERHAGHLHGDRLVQQFFQ